MLVGPSMDSPASGGSNCRGCRAAPGRPHEDGCDWARCPDCGEQLFGHYDCEAPQPGPERPALWHGVDPRCEVAQVAGWWTTVVGIDHLVEDTTRVLYAHGLGQIHWDPTAQRYVIDAIDEAALDQAVDR
jgi:hypothetical protein